MGKSKRKPTRAAKGGKKARKVGLPRVAEGYKRQFLKCKQCGMVQYYDYVPYSLSTPLIAAACHHGAGERMFGSAGWATPLTPSEAMQLLAAQMAPAHP